MIAENRAVLAARHAQERQNLAEQQAAEVDAFESEHGDIDDVKVEGGTPNEALRNLVEFLRHYRGIDHLAGASNGDYDFHLLRRDVSTVVTMALDSLKPKVIVERPLRQCLHTADCDADCRPYC